MHDDRLQDTAIANIVGQLVDVGGNELGARVADILVQQRRWNLQRLTRNVPCFSHRHSHDGRGRGRGRSVRNKVALFWAMRGRAWLIESRLAFEQIELRFVEFLHTPLHAVIVPKRVAAVNTTRPKRVQRPVMSRKVSQRPRRSV